MKNRIFEFWKSNYIEVLLLIGLAFVVIPTFILSYIAGLYLIGVIFIAFAVIFKIWGGGE